MEYYIFVKIVTLPLFFIYPVSFVSSLCQSQEEDKDESMGLIKFFLFKFKFFLLPSSPPSLLPSRPATAVGSIQVCDS